MNIDRSPGADHWTTIVLLVIRYDHMPSPSHSQLAVTAYILLSASSCQATKP